MTDDRMADDRSVTSIVTSRAHNQTAGYGRMEIDRDVWVGA